MHTVQIYRGISAIYIVPPRHQHFSAFIEERKKEERKKEERKKEEDEQFRVSTASGLPL